MKILSLLLLFSLLFLTNQKTESPHGTGFKVSCKTCHSSKGWQFDESVYSFDHNTTKLPLAGQHALVNCRLCHVSLVFSEAKNECSQCHTDVHQSSVGLDCSNCHTPSSWLVNNITEIHQRSRFPLLGAHRTADCYDCHKSENLVRFDVVGVNCIDCHRAIYMSTSDPNHIEAGFSEDCSVCHPVNSFSWAGSGFNHNFFPLVQGHSGIACNTCHTTGHYTDANPECYSCHQTDFNNAVNPNHNTLNFSKICTLCHSTNPGWKPAGYTQHDSQFFPIYSGRHRGQWDQCTDCHADPSNYALFDCKSCHADVHSGKNYSNAQCYSCHPTGAGGD